MLSLASRTASYLPVMHRSFTSFFGLPEMPMDEGVHKNLNVVPSFCSFTRMFSLMPKADLEKAKMAVTRHNLYLLEFKVNSRHCLEFL